MTAPRIDPVSFFDRLATKPDATSVRLNATHLDLDNTPIDVARQQMEQNGITDSQKAGYKPRVSEALYHHVVPYGYTGHAIQVYNALHQAYLSNDSIPNLPAQGNPDLGNTIFDVTPARQDAWRLYLGLPQANKSFGISDYRPAKSYSEKPYFKLQNGWDPTVGIMAEFSPSMGSDEEALRLGIQNLLRRMGDKTQMTISDDNGPRVLGNLKVSRGQDEHGHYLSYYDLWDLNFPGANHAGKPLEVYDRLYYDPKTYKALKDQPKGNTGPDLTKTLQANKPQNPNTAHNIGALLQDIYAEIHS